MQVQHRLTFGLLKPSRTYQQTYFDACDLKLTMAMLICDCLSCQQLVMAVYDAVQLLDLTSIAL